MASRPKFSDAEKKHREELLIKCFNACDADFDGVLNSNDLERLARSFNATDNPTQDVRIVLSQLDKNQDGAIDQTEWVSTLFDIFYFMNKDAFNKHCEELLTALRAQAW